MDINDDAAADDANSEPLDSHENAQLRSLGYRPELRRVLGSLSSFAIQYSTICFSGAILVSLLVGFGQVGPLMIWTFVGASVLQVIVAFCIAELTSAYPLAGGVYQVVTKQGGKFLGWQVGWLIQIAHVTSLGLGTIGLTPIILSWFGVKDPTHWQIVGFSGLLILATTLVNLLRVRIVALVNNIGVASEFLASLTVIVGCTVAFVLGKSHQPMSFLTTDAGVVNGSIVLPLLYSCLLAAFMCSGFDVSGTAGEETHDASRVVPKAAVTANVISLVIGSLVLLMLLLSVPNVQGVLDDVSPVKYILDSVLGSGLASAFEFLAVAALLVNGMVLQAAGARVFWAQARDGAFIGSKWLRRINTDGVPVNGVILSGLIAFALTIYSSLYPVLAAILAVSWAAAYGIAVLIGWRARRAGLLPARAFTLRAGNLWYVVAIVWSAFLCIILTYQEPQKVGVGVLIIIAVGLVVYYTSRSQLPASEPTTTPAPAPRPTAASTNTEEP